MLRKEEPDSRSNTWNWEGMQGNDTDSILTTSVTKDFRITLQSALEEGADTVGGTYIHGQHKNCPHCNAPIQNS